MLNVYLWKYSGHLGAVFFHMWAVITVSLMCVPSSKAGSEHYIELQARGLRGTTWGSMQFMDSGQPRDK